VIPSSPCGRGFFTHTGSRMIELPFGTVTHIVTDEDTYEADNDTIRAINSEWVRAVVIDGHISYAQNTVLWDPERVAWVMAHISIGASHSHCWTLDRDEYSRLIKVQPPYRSL